MTTTINLLPWREERRKQQQQEFIVMLVVAAVVGGLLFWLWQGSVNQQITDQQARNSHIQAKSAELDEKIKEIKEIKARRDELVARMEVIQSLQGNRPSIVYVFDQLVKTLPDGVYYNEISRKDELFTIEGVAESNNRISRLMRNLDESEWFRDANLQNVTAVEDSGGTSQFQLTVKQASANDKEEKKDERL
ncbi:type IV pili biogenesis protein PilN [Alcanivorax nanhaiticus]|uniref:Type IV pili biogenesis protein PilN n=1 Tax=Alcanivorax nanhaiticus TaxID=1177154 RepID=A0A095SIY1_9GAMM|nr:PilN domain-containing protein [Alcanivorax nanhaiticus]KGD64329.1 type IV pili biogenesis protein PilN [Alcanivorax nanhaiticus]